MTETENRSLDLLDLLIASGSVLLNNGGRTPFADYVAKTRIIAKSWREQGLADNDLLVIENLAGMELLEAVLAAWCINAVPFPCDKLRDESFAGRTFKLTSQAIEMLKNGERDPRLNHTAILHRSSGSSGRARLARRSGVSLLAEALRYKTALSLSREDLVLVILPIHHSFGWGFLLGTLLSGCTVDLRSGFSPAQTARELGSGLVSVVALTPPMARLACNRPGARPDRGPRLAVVGAGPVDKLLEEDFANRFGVGLARNYGSTETGATFSGPALLDDAVIGLPMEGVRVVEPPYDATGELVLELDPPVDGYLDEQSTSVWRTGDLVERTIDGLVRVLRRIDNKLHVNGQSLDRVMIEHALLAHPKLEEVYLLAARRPAMPQVEDLVAIVRGVGTSSDELLSYCANHLPASHCPSRVILCEELPRTQIGKPDLTAVLERIAAEKSNGPPFCDNVENSDGATPMNSMDGKDN